VRTLTMNSVTTLMTSHNTSGECGENEFESKPPIQRFLDRTTRLLLGRILLLEVYAIGSHACSFQASRRVTNCIPLGCPLPLTVATVNWVETLKVNAHRRLYACKGNMYQLQQHELQTTNVRCSSLFSPPPSSLAKV
jgi:hypothetical protein